MQNSKLNPTLRATKKSTVHTRRKRFPLSCSELVKKGKRRKPPMGIFLHPPTLAHPHVSHSNASCICNWLSGDGAFVSGPVNPSLQVSMVSNSVRRPRAPSSCLHERPQHSSQSGSDFTYRVTIRCDCPDWGGRRGGCLLGKNGASFVEKIEDGTVDEFTQR